MPTFNVKMHLFKKKFILFSRPSHFQGSHVSRGLSTSFPLRPEQANLCAICARGLLKTTDRLVSLSEQSATVFSMENGNYCYLKLLKCVGVCFSFLCVHMPVCVALVFDVCVLCVS